MFCGSHSVIDIFATHEFNTNPDQDTDSNWDTFLIDSMSQNTSDDYFYSQAVQLVRKVVPSIK
jgi:hypothetical protein